MREPLLIKRVVGSARRGWCVVVACSSMCVGGLDAQVITGQVADGATYEVIEGAAITLMHPDGHDLAEPVTSSASGRFSVPVPGPGSYYLRIERLGYTDIVEGVFDFQSSEGRLAVEVFLLPAPVELEGVDVAVDRVQSRRHLRANGFYERLTDGFGDFITPEQIAERGGLAKTSELLRGIPGITTYQTLVLFRANGPPPKPGSEGPCVRPRSPGDPLVACPDQGEPEELNLCEPNVWIDGQLLSPANSQGRLYPGDLMEGLDAYLTPEDIAAVEVYRGIAGTPLQWSGMNGACGTIVIWTKQGR